LEDIEAIMTADEFERKLFPWSTGSLGEVAFVASDDCGLELSFCVNREDLAQRDLLACRRMYMFCFAD
jgi:hypothetical protein